MAIYENKQKTIPLDKLKWVYEMMSKSRYYEDQMAEVFCGFP